MAFVVLFDCVSPEFASPEEASCCCFRQPQALRHSRLKSVHSSNMLDIDLFRTEKGGDPEKIRENQRRRFADPAMVDRVINSDELWRKGERV